MLSITPYYRKQRKTIVIRVIVNRTVAKVVNTQLKIEPDQWDETNKKVVQHQNKKILNQKIANRVAQLQQEFLKADLLGLSLTRDRVKRIAEGSAVTTDFYKHCEEWIKEKYSNPATRAQAISELNKINGFAPSLQFGDIDKRWLMKYNKYMVEVLHNKGNTPWKAFKFIRTMLYDAKELAPYNPFQSGEFKMPKYIQPEKDGLYLEELDRIEKLFDQPHPVVIKIMAAKFLFMCYTGLRISDAKRFTDLKDGRVVSTHKKTGITTSLKLWDRLTGVLDRMKQYPAKTISDQKLNEYLKIIAELADITRIELTSHVGRHTFGCLLAESGMSEEEAAELMGHKDKKVTRVYFKLRQPQMDRAVEKLNKL